MSKPIRRSMILRQLPEGGYHVVVAESVTDAYQEERLIAAVVRKNNQYQVHPIGNVGMFRPKEYPSLDDAVRAAILLDDVDRS